jgi:hypothetical protein
MSQLDSIDVTCPKCQTEQTVQYWATVNTKLNPELRTELIEGRLDIFTCKKCGQSHQLASPILYHDMARQFAVQYHPGQTVEDDVFIRQFIEQGDLTLRDETDAQTGPANCRGILCIRTLLLILRS